MDANNMKCNTASRSRILWKYLRDDESTCGTSKMKNPETSNHLEDNHESFIPARNEKKHFLLWHPLKMPGFHAEKRTELVKVDFDNLKSKSGLSYKIHKRNNTHLNDDNAERSTVTTNSNELVVSDAPEKRKRKLDLPLSPESKKKDELCSYLQLVNLNTVNSQDNVLIQNRRSTRVKNLLLLTEKKNLEKQLRRNSDEEIKTKENSNSNQIASRLNDLQEENKEQRQNGAKKFKKLLRIKSKNVKKKHFDDAITEYFRNNKDDKIIKRNVKLNKSPRKVAKEKRKKKRHNKIKKYTKDQINEIILGSSPTNTKRTIKRRLILPNTHSLRSRVRYNNITMKKLIDLVDLKKRKSFKSFKKQKTNNKKLESHNSSVIPLLDHDYAISNDHDAKENTTLVESNTKTTKRNFISREITCGINHKENENEMILSLIDKKSEETFCNKLSILKEKLFFNTLKPESDKEQTVNNNNEELARNVPVTNDPKKKLETIKIPCDIQEMPVQREKKSCSPEIQCITKQAEVKLVDILLNPPSPKLLSTKLNNSIQNLIDNNCNNGRSTTTFIPLDTHVEVNSLYKNLTQQKRRNVNKKHDGDLPQTWYPEEANKLKDKRNSHSIHTSKEDGIILDAIYLDNCLVIVQELLITFYNQTPLGNVLGAQNMWLPRGQVQRLLLSNNGCEQKQTSSNVIILENSVSYVELWTKEHKSEKRERPVCDVFAAIYFIKAKQTKPDKKVLQLENIKAFANDVRYIVKNNSRNIIVSWSEIDSDKKVTIIRCYNFESDYQTVASITEMQSVNYVITSLHNVEDGDSLMMGFSESKATLWNLEYGYVIASIDICDIKPQPETLWVKCERGFLFTLQDTRDGNLRLVAIRGMNHSWKQLTSFKAPEEYSNTSLRGACIEHGILIAFYENGVLCWNAQTGELLMEAESSNLNYFPSLKYVVITTMGQVLVKHALSYLITV